MWTGLAVAAIGLLWSILPPPGADTDYFPRIRRPTYGRSSPRVLIDEAHWNIHTARGRYRGFAQLIERDGYRVTRNKEPFAPGLFQGVHILVIANALGFRGVLQQVAETVGLDGRLSLAAGAFEPVEIAAVRNWVRSGGSLLLAADHAPCGAAARSLALAFGIELTDAHAQDPRPTILFERGKGLMDHPITLGRSDLKERVDRVATYSRQSLTHLADTQPLLTLSAPGRAQAVAVQFGKGRVVLMADAAALTAQVINRDGHSIRFGINDDQTGNQQFTLNILHWLSRAL